MKMLIVKQLKSPFSCARSVENEFRALRKTSERLETVKSSLQ